jgi:hypothetical protein
MGHGYEVHLKKQLFGFEQGMVSFILLDIIRTSINWNMFDTVYIPEQLV